MSRRRVLRGLVLVVLGALSVAAVLRLTEGSPLRLPTGEPSYDATAPTWYVDGEVHVGPQRVALPTAPDEFVVTPSGIYYLVDRVLYFTDGDDTDVEEVADLGRHGGELTASVGGKFVGLVDQAHGPDDEFGGSYAAPVVLATDDGHEVLRGEPSDQNEFTEDYEAFYPEVEPDFYGFGEDAAFAFDPAAEGGLRFPLDGSPPEGLVRADPADDLRPVLPSDQVLETMTLEVRQGLLGATGPGGYWLPDAGALDGQGQSSALAYLSPSGEVYFRRSDRSRPRYFDAATGERTSFDPGRRTFRLGGWLDERTFWGITTSSRNRREARAGGVVTCRVGEPTCSAYGSEVLLEAGEDFILPS